MNGPPRILVIEDDPLLGPALLQRLRLEGFAPRLAATGASALKEVAQRSFAAVVSDIRLPDMTGEDVFRRMLDSTGLLPVLFVTAFGDVDQAVRLMKAGARDYLTKPVDVDALVAALRAVVGERAGPPPTGAAAPTPDADTLGASPAMRRVEAMLRKIADLPMPVLLRGGTGVGKEVAARRLHALSARATAPFLAVNCAAIPKDLLESTIFGHEKGAFTGATARQPGLAERAGQGILFLDEIAELAPEMQAKLLRLVQERSFLPVGAGAELPFLGRLVAATHADLAARVAAGQFREDLYYRINVVEIVIPPLHERAEDVAPLAEAFLREASARFGRSTQGFTPEAAAALAAHAWPGNVRELRNRIERAVALAEGPELGLDDLFPEGSLDLPAPSAATGESSLGNAARDAIRKRVLEALARSNGNQAEAARLLGVSRTTVWKYARG
ncbi:MAG: sigma-54-dependent Fis family transcriptional regulator [Alphaproteobacteria bacterium]|nr:sigma-54-dependent Fis family transcriptional regulator [Alphaproteobacteria bacterium]